jgi:hypothetical protein
LKAIVLENMKKSEDGKIVYSSITKEDLKKTQTDENDVS